MADDALHEIEKRLTDTARRHTDRTHLRAALDAATTQRSAAKGELARRRDELNVSADDVRSLESLSLTRILAGLKGTREADLDQRTAEHDAARYRVALAERRVDVADDAVAKVQAQIDELGDVDTLLAAALADKEALLLQTEAPHADRLAAIASRRGELDALDRESREALIAAQHALELLEDAERTLGSADAWSTYDTWFGGGALSSMAKQGRLDEAVQILRRASDALAAFEREVADLGLQAAAHVELERWDRVFDIWFDNVFTDFAIRRRIKDALADVEHACEVVESVAGQVSMDARQFAHEQTQLAIERDELVFRA